MRTGVVVVTGLVVLLSACATGVDTETARLTGVDRTVTVSMKDNSFVPTKMTVRRGERIGFRFVNDGKVAHDAFVGDHSAQREHEEEMRMMDREHGGHSIDGTDAITVEPRGTGTLKHRFTEAGTLEIGCHQAGHYAAGMIMKITVR